MVFFVCLFLSLNLIKVGLFFDVREARRREEERDFIVSLCDFFIFIFLPGAHDVFLYK